jgi:Family of unknown function (DUF5677)
MALVDKALYTFQAIIVLVNKGDAGDAYSLLRTFVESTVNAAYIRFKGDEAADTFVDFLTYRRWIEFQGSKHTAEWHALHDEWIRMHSEKK